jgi:hypothetical protein
MDVGDQIHVPAALLPRKRGPLHLTMPIGYEAGLDDVKKGLSLVSVWNQTKFIRVTQPETSPDS